MKPLKSSPLQLVLSPLISTEITGLTVAVVIVKLTSRSQLVLGSLALIKYSLADKDENVFEVDMILVSAVLSASEAYQATETPASTTAVATPSPGTNCPATKLLLVPVRAKLLSVPLL